MNSTRGQKLFHVLNRVENLIERKLYSQAKQILAGVLQRFPGNARARRLLRSVAASQKKAAGFSARMEKNFLTNREFILQSAVPGWRYAFEIDDSFIGYEKEKNRQSEEVVLAASADAAHGCNDINLQATLSDLSSISDISARWKAMLRLCDPGCIPVLDDSFCNESDKDIQSVLTEFLSKDELNIVIIGCGPVGLALANSLKVGFGDSVSILMTDNRVDVAHQRRPFNRHWLVNLPNKLFNGIYAPEVTHLLNEFGDGVFAGGTLATIEVLLLISNKNRGVRFLFDTDIDYSFLDRSAVDLIFDASGGAFQHSSILAENNSVDMGQCDHNVRVSGIKSYGAGHAAHGIVNHHNTQDTTIKLRRERGYLIPSHDDRSLEYGMFKITGVPLDLYNALLEFVKKMNHDSMFYVWPGKLRPEINEILLLINLTGPDYSVLSASVTRRMTLKSFWGSVDNQLTQLDIRVSRLFEFLLESEADVSGVNISPPFTYSPYCRAFSEELDRLHQVPIFPIGDSLFCGNPKAGNGLGRHFRFVAKLHDMAMLVFGAN